MGAKLCLPKEWCAELSMDEVECEKISNEILDVYESDDRKTSGDIAHLLA